MALRQTRQQTGRGSPAPGGRSCRASTGGFHGVGAPLSGEHERELIAASDDGDASATAELVDAFMPAIDSIAYLYRSFANLEHAELRQEGVVGLLRAAKRYDQALRTPFWAYASWWVRQAMQQLVSDLVGPVVLSDRAARRLVRVKRARGAYQQAHGREPSLAELATESDLPPELVEDLLAIERTPRGLDERSPGDSEGAPTFADGLANPLAEDAYERIGELIEGEHFRDLTADLDERERSIVFAHYGIGSRQCTLREIAGGLEISVERVRQLEERALGKLREADLAGH